MHKLVVVGLFLLLIGSPAAAQETTGSVSGRVVDAQGLPVPGAVVTVTRSPGDADDRDRR